MAAGKNKILSIRNISFLLVNVSFLWLLSGCAVKKELGKKNIIPPKNPEFVFEELKKNELQFDWLSLKAEVNTILEEKTNSFKVNIRIRKDSLMWISVSTIFGVEAFRLEITPDSLKIMDKINSAYFIGEIDSLLDKFDVDADFETLQSLLVGNSLDLKDSSNLKVSLQKGDYLLSTFKKRMLKRLIRKNEKLEKKSEKLEKKTSVGDSEKKSLKYEKKSEKIEKEDDKYDMVLQSFWVDAVLYKIKKISINDLKTNQTLIAEYENFAELESQKIPRIVRFSSENKKNMKATLEYSRFIINVPQSVPFNIPEKYERKF